MSMSLGGWTIDGWTLLGFAGQALFSLRFIVQWISSERAKRSTIPNAFWWFSIGGGMLLFTYAAFGRHDIVFSLGQGMGLFIYFRNLVLLRRNGPTEVAPLRRGDG